MTIDFPTAFLWLRTLVFRGFVAAASLKPHNHRACWHQMMQVFRGFVAAASLKRRSRARIALVPDHVFRGFVAAASLKREELADVVICVDLSSAALLPRPH